MLCYTIFYAHIVIFQVVVRPNLACMEPVECEKEHKDLFVLYRKIFLSNYNFDHSAEVVAKRCPCSLPTSVIWPNCRQWHSIQFQTVFVQADWVHLFLVYGWSKLSDLRSNRIQEKIVWKNYSCET